MENPIGETMKLSDLIKENAIEGDDPRQLAERVAKIPTARELRNLFADAIVDDCRQYLMGTRNNVLNNGPVRRTNTSARLKRQRNWWSEFLAVSEHVGNGVWKTLGDCTVEDLAFLIEERQTNIARIQVHIDRYERLDALMRQHQVKHVRDLPQQAVESEWAA